MLYLVVGEDWVWKKLVLKTVTKGWKDPEVVWADSVTESWLSSYIDVGNNLVVKRADNLSDKFSVSLKGWRGKNVAFVAEDMRSGSFKRRVGRLGRKKDCSSKARDRAATVVLMCKKFGVKVSEQAASRLTVTEAYWLIQKARMLGANPETLLERSESQMAAVVTWNQLLLKMPITELARRAGCLASAHRLLKAGQSKWRVVQEATRLAPGEVAAMYAAALRLSDDQRRFDLLARRMELLSELAEEAEPVTAHVFLKGRDL